MDSNEILNKYINLIDKGYCSDCNELNCIDNFPHAKITHAIIELQQENKKQKEVIDKAMIELDTIINDLEKHGDEAPAPSKEELCKIFNILKKVTNNE